MDESNSTSFPQVLGPYTLFKSLGKGGMGEVFLAEDSLCERKVALKKIRQELQKFPSIRNRFLREARIAAQLSHPSIVPIFTISDQPGSSYYTMPYIEGMNLKEILKEARHSEQKGSIPHLTRIFLAICQAVAYAHSKKILHRDLKPENVIVGKFGEVMIVDWGLAQAIDQGNDLEETLAENIPPHCSVTRPGKVVGTLAYLAPERAHGKAASEQTDLYALGVILFQILTLKIPFRRGDLETFQKRWKLEQVPDPIETAPDRDIPHALSQITLRSLSIDPKERYSSVQHLVSDLESFIEGKPEWVVTAYLDVEKKEDWEFQELIMLAKHMAITRVGEMEWVNLMISKDPFPGNCRLETTVKLCDSSQGVGFLIGAASRTERKNLMEGFCIWIGGASPGCQLFCNNIEVLRIPSITLEPEHPYAIRIEKTDYQLKLYIDSDLRMHYLSQTPLMGSQVGLVRKDTHLELAPLKISLGSQNVTVSCLALPDALLSYKEYDKALAEYRKIATSFPGRTEGRQAQYRAATTLVQMGAYDAALEEFGKLRGTAGAPLEYLGKAIVYQTLGEWEEEAKCLELAIRKYNKHPLFQRLVEHVVFRLHESSSHHRLAAYHLALLACRHLPQIFQNHDNEQIIEEIRKTWRSLPYFSPQATAVQLAFLLSRPSTLMEMVKSGEWVEEAFFGLLELGAYALVRQSPQLEQYPNVQAAVQAAESTPLSTAPANSALTLYLFYLLFDHGRVEEIALEGLDATLKLAALIATRRFEEANSFFEQCDEQQLTQEGSPFFTLLGCYLWAVEGEETAKSLFSGLEDMPYPPSTALLAYYVMGKINLSGSWFEGALYWEKLSLYRQMLLLAYATQDLAQIQQVQSRIKSLKERCFA